MSIFSSHVKNSVKSSNIFFSNNVTTMAAAYPISSVKFQVSGLVFTCVPAQPFVPKVLISFSFDGEMNLSYHPKFIIWCQFVGSKYVFKVYSLVFCLKVIIQARFYLTKHEKITLRFALRSLSNVENRSTKE